MKSIMPNIVKQTKLRTAKRKEEHKEKPAPRRARKIISKKTGKAYSPIPPRGKKGL